MYADSPSKKPVKDMIKDKIIPQLRQNFQKLGPRLIQEHGKDIQHSSESLLASGTSTPKESTILLLLHFAQNDGRSFAIDSGMKGLWRPAIRISIID